MVEPRSMTTSAPSGTTWNWACVFDSDMSDDVSAQQRVHRLPGPRLGATPDQHQPLDVSDSPVSNVTRQRTAGGRPTSGQPSPCRRGDAPRPVGVVRRRQRGRRGAGGGTGTSRIGGQVDDRTAAPRPPRPRAQADGRRPRTSQAAGRASPRRRPPGSATAVQASAAAPKPNVGRVASPSTTVRSSARGTPIGWPSSDAETRRPEGGLARARHPRRRQHRRDRAPGAR